MFKQLTKITEHTIKDYSHKLQWIESLGIGYLPSDGYEYGEAYWEHYLDCSHGWFGERLTELRADFVTKNEVSLESLCDVGVGSGQFVEFANCKGADVNPLAITWLKDQGRYTDHPEEFTSLTLWDVIEHIDDPRPLLAKVENVFISTPVYKDLDACLKSKHLKPGEHIWYFTDMGVKNFMSQMGFAARYTSDFETVLGRESIMSYYFKKVK